MSIHNLFRFGIDKTQITCDGHIFQDACVNLRRDIAKLL